MHQQALGSKFSQWVLLTVLFSVIAFFFWPVIFPAAVFLAIAERKHRKNKALGGLWLARAVMVVVTAPLVLASGIVAKTLVYDVYYRRARVESETRVIQAVREIRTGLGRFAEREEAFPATLADLAAGGLLKEEYSGESIHGYLIDYRPHEEILDETRGSPRRFAKFVLGAYPGWLTLGKRNFMMTESGVILTRETLEDVEGIEEPAPADWPIQGKLTDRPMLAPRSP